MIARHRPLLVARLVLFVHHDGGESLHRGEHRGARPHGHPPLAAPQRPPCVGALAVREARMQHRDLVAEDAPHPGHRLRRERDLGNEQDRALPRRHDAA